MPLVDQNLFTLPEHMSSPTDFLGSCYSNFSFVWNVCSSSLFSFGHCIVCPSICVSWSSIYVLRSPLDLRLKITPLVSSSVITTIVTYKEDDSNTQNIVRMEEYIRASYLLYFTNIKLLLYQKRQSLIITSQSCLLSADSCFSGVRADNHKSVLSSFGLLLF
jgi:hypothetical protein